MLSAAPVEGVLGQSPLTKIVWVFRVLEIGLKSTHIWWYSSSLFLLFSLCSFFKGTKKSIVEQEIESTIQCKYEIAQYYGLSLCVTLTNIKLISCFHFSP